jgi:hypothetical protein
MSRANVQELRGQYVRRLPTPEEIATRSPIVLTERDRELLVAVHRHGFMTTDLVELAFFPPRTGNGIRSSASSKAYERLRELWLWGYLERIELPVARVLGGRRPFLYSLGRQGVAFVETRMGTTALPVQPRRLDRLDHVFVDHDLKAAALWANLRDELRGRRGCKLSLARRARAQGQAHACPRAAGGLLAALPARRLLQGHLSKQRRPGRSGRN